MPSPTIATLASRFISLTKRSLSCGSSSASHSMPSLPAIACAVRRLSPVSMTERTPMALSWATPSRASRRGSSRRASRPRTFLLASSNRTTTVLPPSSSLSISLRCAAVSVAVCSAWAGDPTASALPFTVARTALPAMADAPVAWGIATSRLLAWATMAFAKGWFEPDSTAAASARTC